MSEMNRTGLRRSGNWLGTLFLSLFLFFVVFQIWSVKQSIEKVSELAKTTVSYSSYTPDKTEYYPGDLVRFTFTRTAHEDNQSSYPILLLVVDGLTNQDTGEVFPGVFAPRIIRHSGAEVLHALRKLPDYITPGTYILEGYASTQTNRLTRVNHYTSDPFKVLAKPEPTPTLVP